MKACPKCKSRATKIFNLSTGKYACQLCDHEWKVQEPIKKIENPFNWLKDPGESSGVKGWDY